MKTYQLTLAGFDGSTDRTDHLIKWVNAPSRAALDLYIKAQRWRVHQIETPWPDEVLTIAEGVDAILDENGNEVAAPVAPANRR